MCATWRGEQTQHTLRTVLAFYRDGLGLPTKGIEATEFEDGAVVFFRMNQNLMLALYPKAALAQDAHVSVGSPSVSEFRIGYNVGSKQPVDTVMQQAKQAGAKITDPAHDRFWGGYSGYFQDPDWHLWEVAWYPPGDATE